MVSKENKLFIAIILASLIISASIYAGITGLFIDEDPNFEDKPINFDSQGFVTKVIDGDTVIIEGSSVRLLGIDTDERGYPCYDEAKKRLEELVLNKEVKLEKDGENKDQYGRYLRFIFLEGENINLKLVKEGLAVSRFSPKNKKYKREILTAEKKARENEVGCKWGETSPETQESYSECDWEGLTEKETDLDTVGACNSGNYQGKKKIVQGKIVGTYKSKTNTVFLNFEKPYPNHCFTAVIFSSDLYKFPEDPQDYFNDKAVRVKGKIKEYKGKPEVILESMEQVEVGKCG